MHLFKNAMEFKKLATLLFFFLNRNMFFAGGFMNFFENI